MNLTHPAPLARLALLVLAGPILAQDYYVNGRTGTDAPGFGTSPGTPWKTITYALAQIPRPTHPAGRRLLVEGNQVYSPTTNGETLPIVPAFNVGIEGAIAGHGRSPVIGIPAGQTGMRFRRQETYHRDQVMLRRLAFDGGVHGVELGADPGQRHRPHLLECSFQGQTGAGVALQTFAPENDDPRFFQNSFTGPGDGVRVYASGSGAVVQPEFEENWFHDLVEGSGVVLADLSPGGATLGASFRSNFFARCSNGIWLRSAEFAPPTNVTVADCSFVSMRISGLRLDYERPGDPALLVRDCSFVHCESGIRALGVTAPRPYRIVLARNTVTACPRGLWVRPQGVGIVAVSTTGNRFEDCGFGAQVDPIPASVAVDLHSEGDRIHSCAAGWYVSSPGSLGATRIESAHVTGCPGTGIGVSATHPVVLLSCTVADNGRGVALAYFAAGSSVDHCIFSGNTIDLIAPAGATPTYSCFESSSWPGAGNLNHTNPQLLRPTYKLGPGSPCIDKGDVSAALPATDYEGDPRFSVGRVGGLPLPDLGADEYVLAGSVHAFGTRGFGLFRFLPRIASPNATARIGESLRIDLLDARLPVSGTPASAAVLTLGLRDDHGFLPLELSAYGAPGSLLWNDLLVTIGPLTVTPAGTATFAFPIPPLGALVGTPATFQWFAALGGVNAAGAVTTDGLRVTIGR